MRLFRCGASLVNDRLIVLALLHGMLSSRFADYTGNWAARRDTESNYRDNVWTCREKTALVRMANIGEEITRCRNR